MKRTYIILLLTLFLAGATNGTMDKLQFHYDKSVFTKLSEHVQNFFNPAISWKLKYKNVDAGDYRPKFLLSITILVAFTDAWHLLKLIWELLIATVIGIAFKHKDKIAWYWIILIFSSYKMGFYLTWSYLLNL